MQPALSRRAAHMAARAGRAASRAATAVGVALRSLPGAAGAVAVAYGCGQVYPPLFWIVSGVALLMLDRRIP